MEDVACFVLIEHAGARHLLALKAEVARFVIVVDLTGGDLVVAERDAEVGIEVAAPGRHPFEASSHTATGSNWAKEARDTAIQVTPRCARWASAPSIWSQWNEQPTHPCCQPGPNMKCLTINWLRLSNRSARVSRPFGPSKTYGLSILTHRKARICAVSLWCWRVCSFSFSNSALRTESHWSRDTPWLGELHHTF